MNLSVQSPFSIALQRFKKNLWGVFSLTYLIIWLFIALLAYPLATDTSENANQMHLSIHSKPPGFTVSMLMVPETNKPQTTLTNYLTGFPATHTEIPISTYYTQKQILYYTQYTNDKQVKPPVQSIALYKLGKAPHITTRKFWLGTDKFGRDIYSRLIIGSRVSLAIGFIGVFISLLIGIPIGAIAGYYGGKTDAFLMWVINIVWSIPTVLLVIAITLALGKGFWQVFIAVGLTLWVEVARVVRGQVISLKQMQYVTAAKAFGYSSLRIIWKHILPNAWGPIIVISAANFASAILVESGLSFLGLGAQPPTPSWGGMIKEHYPYIILGKAYLALIPGIAMLTLVLAVMLIGNALRDVLDVKTNKI